MQPIGVPDPARVARTDDALAQSNPSAISADIALRPNAPDHDESLTHSAPQTLSARFRGCGKREDSPSKGWRLGADLGIMCGCACPPFALPLTLFAVVWCEGLRGRPPRLRTMSQKGRMGAGNVSCLHSSSTVSVRMSSSAKVQHCAGRVV